MKKEILHIITGGTILGEVPEYGEVYKLAKIFNDSMDIEKYAVESLKIYAGFSTKEVCRKDSRDINESDRKLIVSLIEQSFMGGVRNFLITHGTYTMPDTGVFIIDNLPKDILDEVSIIITGAMYPNNFIGSDALLNVGASLAGLVNAKKPLGVKICMHAKYWNPKNIRKNAENLIFEEK